MNEQKEYSPYCPVCTACGIDGCCSPLGCSQDSNGHYCAGYLLDLKFGYAMNEWVQKNLLDEELIPKELIEKYNQQWEKDYDFFYKEEKRDDE
jgi:hypothetical protein